MKYLLILIASTGILLTLIPSILVIMNVIEASRNNLLMGIGMVLWFVSMPVYMKSYGKRDEHV